MSRIDKQITIVRDEKKVCDLCGTEIKETNKLAVSDNGLDFCNFDHKRLYDQEQVRIENAGKLAGNCAYCEKPLKNIESYKFKEKGEEKVACNSSHANWHKRGLHIGDGNITPDQGPTILIPKSKLEIELESLKEEVAKLKENR